MPPRVQGGMGASKGRVVRCQVEECSNQVPQKAYYQRYRICKHHSCLSSLELGGKQQRWCQQCGRFHELSEFDGDKRTCRVKLGHHNQRRKAARLLNCSLSEEGCQLAAASSLQSSLSEASAQSPAASHGEHALPPGGQEQPPSMPVHVAGQRQSQQQASQHNLKAPLHAHPQQRQHMSQQSMQFDGDCLPAQLAQWAKPSLGRQQQQRRRALPAWAPAARQGVATSAAMLCEGQQKRPGAGFPLAADGASGDGISNGHLAACRLHRPRGALPPAWSLPHVPIGHADLAAMLAAPKRICKDPHAATAYSKHPSHVRGPTKTHPGVPGQLASPAAGPPLSAAGPSLAAASTPLGAKAPCQPPQPQQQLPAVVPPAGSKQASPGGNLDDILELLSWRSPREDEPVSGSLEGSWLSPPALPLSVPGSPLLVELAGAQTPFSPDLLLPS